MHQQDPNSIKAADLALGDTITIQLKPVAGQPDALLMGTVMASTPKAVRMHLEARRGTPRSVWFPRRALTHLVRDRGSVQSTMARWWAPNDRQAHIIDACTHAGEGVQ